MTTADRARSCGVLISTVLLALTASACSGDPGTKAQQSTPAPTGTSSAPSAGTPATTGVPIPSRSATGAPSGSTASTSSSSPTSSVAGSLVPVPSVSRPTRPAVAISSPASFGGGVGVVVASVRAVTVTGRGPGETSGPAVAFALRVTNGTSSSISLRAANVEAQYGNATPASPSDASPAKGWPSALPAGRSVAGTFVFLMPVDQRGTVQISVSYDPRQPVVVLRGAAPR